MKRKRDTEKERYREKSYRDIEKERCREKIIKYRKKQSGRNIQTETKDREKEIQRKIGL